MAMLSIQLFGPFQVNLDDKPVTNFETEKERALLAYLAVEEDRPHRRAFLAEMFWPGRPEGSARANLSHTLGCLRRTIGDHGAELPFLIITRGTIQLNTASDVWVDVEDFSNLISGTTLSGQPNIGRLCEAVELYRGAFLEGISVRDSPTFEEWVLLKREQLGRQAWIAFYRLAEGYQRLGETEQALRHAQRLVALEPWDEKGQRQMMRLLALSGQRKSALDQYESCRRTLEVELGIEPEEETVALYAHIRDGKQLSALASAPPHNLPTYLTPFVGREKELAVISERLVDPNCRLLSLVGPGGIGKTRLAIQAARQTIQDPQDKTAFSQGVFFIALVGVREIESIIPSIASALNFRFHGEGDIKQQLLSYLRKKQLLLVLDNFEHLLDGANVLTEILAAAPSVRILVTSREALNLQGEWFHQVDGMLFPTEIESEQESDDLATYGAVELFVQNALRVDPNFSLSKEKAWVAQVCQLLDGMPLAIEMAATWLKTLPLTRIISEIESGLDILVTSSRNVPARHHSMYAVFDHSWKLLTEPEQKTVQALSVFEGGIRFDAAEKVAGANLLSLAELVDKSILSPASAGRYQMHELFRQYAGEKLFGDPQNAHAVRHRHCEYFAAFLEKRGEALKGDQQQSALAEIEEEVENARSAWNWAVERDHSEHLKQAIEGMCLFFEWRGRLLEGETVCSQAARRLSDAVSPDDLRLLATVLTWQGRFTKWLGRTECAQQLLERSLTILERPELTSQETQKEKAFTLQTMADLPLHAEEVRQFSEESLTLWRVLGDRWEEANGLYCLSWSLRNLGYYSEVQRPLEESLAIRRAIGDLRGIAESLHGLAGVALRQRRFDMAERLARDAIEIRQEIGDLYGTAMGLGVLGGINADRGKYAEGYSLFEESIDIFRDLGVRGAMSWVRTWQGFTEIHLGQYDQAGVQGQAALTFYRSIGFGWGGQRSLYLLGCIALARGRCAEAQDFLQESVKISRKMGARDGLACPLAWLGYTLWCLGHRRKGAEYLSQALRMAQEMGARFILPELLPAVAVWLAERRNSTVVDAQESKVLAIELYALASSYRQVSSSLWFRDVAGKRIDAIVATVPVDVVVAAQERGRVRDLETTAADLLVELDRLGG